jgi:hypothetical protein
MRQGGEEEKELQNEVLCKYKVMVIEVVKVIIGLMAEELVAEVVVEAMVMAVTVEMADVMGVVAVPIRLCLTSNKEYQ